MSFFHSKHGLRCYLWLPKRPSWSATKAHRHRCHCWVACNCAAATRQPATNVSTDWLRATAPWLPGRSATTAATGLRAMALRLAGRRATTATAGLRATALRLPRRPATTAAAGLRATCGCQNDLPRLPPLGCVQPLCGHQGDRPQLLHWGDCNCWSATKAHRHRCYCWVAHDCAAATRRPATNVSTDGLRATAPWLPGRSATTAAAGLRAMALRPPDEGPQLLLLGCVQLLCGCQGEGA